MSRDIQKRDIDFNAFRAFNSRVPVAANDLIRLQELSFGVADDTALAALSVTGLDTGAIRWCGNFRRWFYLDKTGAASTLAAVVGEVVIASDGTSRWIAAPIADALWLSKAAWGVNSLSAGADRSATTNVQTLRELNRRLFGSLYGFQPIITLANDIPLSDATVMHNVRSVNGLGFPTMIGTKTQIGGDYAVTSFVPASATVGTGGSGYLVNATGIGDAGNVGMLLETTDGTIAAWIQDNPSANQVRINTPSNGVVLAGSPGAYASLATRTVRVYQVTRLPVYPFGPLSGFSALGWIRFGFGYRAQFDQAQIGSASPFISRCKTEGAWIGGGADGGWNACLFSNDSTTPTNFSRHGSFVNFCAARGGGGGAMLLGNSSNLICQGSGTEETALDLQAAQIQIEGGSTLGEGVWSMSAFGCTASVIRIGTSGNVQQYPGNIYGTGNTGYLLSAVAGNKCVFDVANINFATTKPTLAHIAGRDEDLPFSGLDSGSFVSQGTL